MDSVHLRCQVRSTQLGEVKSQVEKMKKYVEKYCGVSVGPLGDLIISLGSLSVGGSIDVSFVSPS